MKPEKIDASTVRDADILIVRTRTKVNEQLLKGSNVQLVCTATIGYDHIDTAYCESHGIRWMSCPGCNAQAVCDYIEEAIDEYVQASTPILPLTIGVVGVGHVGSKVAAMAERKRMKVLLNDPPKGIGISLDKIGRNSDIITFHVPLISSPLHGGIEGGSTYHLCDEAFLAKCNPGALIINAARGGVVDEEALLRSGHPFILDTWEGEPDINPAVLNGAFRASMHIAGYSVEGKRNASQMCLNAIAEQFSLPKINLSAYPYLGPSAAPKNGEPWLDAISLSLKAHPENFEALRKDYPFREG
ncbi:MAG: 4-phosphoerythronate dehydrogenase [Paludibacteraceae bacterium]|nr:4-phosphoerythronate dehydrogenase [Paludibacteraceae bacterium]